MRIKNRAILTHISNVACSLVYGRLMFVIFLKLISLVLSYFKKKPWIKLPSETCIYTSKRYKNVSLDLHAQDAEDSRAISFNCSNHSNIFSKLDKSLETFKIYFCSRAMLIEPYIDLLLKLYYLLEVYSKHCETSKMKMFEIKNLRFAFSH